MNESNALAFFQAVLLVTDGVGIFASYTIAQYYKPNGWRFGSFWRYVKGKEFRYPITLLYLFFYLLAVVFVALSVSDVLVIIKAPQSWATLPIIRGLAFRFPITMFQLWMIHRQHARQK